MPEFDYQEIREATCVHTQKIYDSCQAKDCVEGIRFYPTLPSVPVLNAASSLKNGRAELLYVYLTVESVGLGRGFYTIDMRFFYKITVEAVVNCTQTIPVCGLAFFDKRSVLFGSEGAQRPLHLLAPVRSWRTAPCPPGTICPRQCWRRWTRFCWR